MEISKSLFILFIIIQLSMQNIASNNTKLTTKSSLTMNQIINETEIEDLSHNHNRSNDAAVSRVKRQYPCNYPPCYGAPIPIPIIIGGFGGFGWQGYGGRGYGGRGYGGRGFGGRGFGGRGIGGRGFGGGRGGIGGFGGGRGGGRG